MGDLLPFILDTTFAKIIRFKNQFTLITQLVLLLGISIYMMLTIVLGTLVLLNMAGMTP